LGNAIQDINENNPLTGFNYVFSTGSYIDSLTFSGNVTLAETGKTDTTLLIFLYNDLSDSAVFKHKPKYITRVNNKGDFTFQHLAEGTYNVFALKDESGQKIYNNPSQIFAFADSTIAIPASQPVKLFAYAEEKPFTKPTASKPESKLTFATSLNNDVQDLLNPLALTFSNQLKKFDSTKIALTDTNLVKINTIALSIDSANKLIAIKNIWPEETQFKLIIDSTFATDTSGNHLAKSDTLSFVTAKERDYGGIKINFTNLDKFAHPVLQFVTNNEVVQSFPITSTTWSRKLFKPGEYELRILDDANENGIWDPGNYHLRRQPEKVFNIPQSLNIRANWENERDIILKE
jgi:uncharacterized protein (DUF2141 family)